VTRERDDYDVFLDTWEPGPILNYATLPQNLNDPMARLRLLDDSTGAAHLCRSSRRNKRQFSNSHSGQVSPMPSSTSAIATAAAWAETPGGGS
jgi:hypothetical protein